MRPTLPLITLLALCIAAPAHAKGPKRGPPAKSHKTGKTTRPPKEAKATSAALRRIELIAGEWTEVSADAKPGRVTMGGCYPAYRSYTMIVEGAAVRVLGHEVAWGAKPAPWAPSLEGTLRETGFDAEGKNAFPPPGTSEAWSVRYEEASEHLIGTRNGKPLRLARLRIEPPNGPCKGGPP